MSDGSTDRITIDEIVAMFGDHVDAAAVRDGVRTTCRKLKIAERPLSRDEALAVLEDLATTPGLLGTIALFAKARVLLRS
jgi:hypothetical protein